ncbi:hypothetical protein B4100_3660 [Heyndrickxia coagulans]|nr:hypothetical protein B4100_3660 [Heyndrickxia coagulans]
MIWINFHPSFSHFSGCSKKGAKIKRATILLYHVDGFFLLIKYDSFRKPFFHTKKAVCFCKQRFFSIYISGVQ